MIHDKLKHLRESLGLTQYEFSKRVGLSQPAIHQFEHGKRYPSIHALGKISQTFNIPIDTLIENKTKDPNTPVLVTDAVLKGLDENAKIWVFRDLGDRKTYDLARYKGTDYDGYPIWEFTPYDCVVCEDDGYEYPTRLQENYRQYIVADIEDHKTIEYLKKFTDRGVYGVPLHTPKR